MTIDLRIAEPPEAIDIEMKLARGGRLPSYQSRMAAGIDLCAAQDAILAILPGDVALIKTGVSLNMMGHRDVVGLVFIRSSVGVKRNLALANTVGVIDADYQGEILLNIRNMSRSVTAMIAPGDRLAQLVLMPILVANLIPVERFSSTTERGEGGFGSTDRKES